MPRWSESSHILMSTQIKTKNLIYRDIIYDFYKALKQINILNFNKKIIKNLFILTNNTAKQTSEKNNLSKRNYTKWKQSDLFLDQACRVYGGKTHIYRRCFYLFGERASKGWTEFFAVRKAVNIALKKDTSLYEKCERLKI